MLRQWESAEAFVSSLRESAHWPWRAAPGTGFVLRPSELGERKALRQLVTQ